MKRMEWAVVVKGTNWRNEFSATSRQKAREAMYNQKAVFKGIDDVDVRIYLIKEYIPVGNHVVRFYEEKR